MERSPVLGISSRCRFSLILSSAINICGSVWSGTEPIFTGTEVPHATNRVLGEDDSEAVEALANLPLSTNVNDRVVHAQNKGIQLACYLLSPIFDVCIPKSPLFQYLEEDFKFQTQIVAWHS